MADTHGLLSTHFESNIKYRLVWVFFNYSNIYARLVRLNAEYVFCVCLCVFLVVYFYVILYLNLLPTCTVGFEIKLVTVAVGP